VPDEIAPAHLLYWPAMSTPDVAPPPVSNPPTPERLYHERLAHFTALRDRYARRGMVNGNISLTLILGALALLGVGVWQRQPALMAAAGALALAFLVSYIVHGRTQRAERRYSVLRALNEEGLQRLRRDWHALPLRRPPGEPLTDDTATDLDLLGHASLQHLLNTPTTPAGLATLQSWLLTPSPVAAARMRQQGAIELAPRVELREEIGLRGRAIGVEQPNYERFLAWAGGSPFLAGRPWLLWLARALALTNLALLGGLLAGLPLYPPLVVSLLAGAAITLTLGRQLDAIIDQVATRQQVFVAYGELFGLLAAQQFESPELRRLLAEMTASGMRADQQMRRLSRLMPLADIRRWMFFAAIQVTTLWNVHLLWLLERWQHDSGGHARAWLTALGELEALVALATLHFDNPGWAFPELSDGPSSRTLEASGLGHPLLSDDVRAPNDVAVGPPGTFLLVTGSNMSGKSTLLRSIGVNAALAQAGGPVCATSMRLPPLALVTSVRVQDSLERGTSYFMAELLRLKEVIDGARRARDEGRLPLFLLDEILHGTNTAERQIAARRIITHLLSLGAIGVVSTHDLTLAAAPELADAAQQAHFRESFTRGPLGPSMRFDYRLLPGPATSTNALKLMELVGLPVEPGEV
jgi:ABC-type multidrug transport system fused ATPase/permease subunit